MPFLIQSIVLVLQLLHPFASFDTPNWFLERFSATLKTPSCGELHQGSTTLPNDERSSSFEESKTQLSSATFTALGNKYGYVNDGHHVWDGDNLLPDADPKTFTMFRDAIGQTAPYAKDKSHVWWQLSASALQPPIEVPADPETFAPLFDNSGRLTAYYRDSSRIFFSDNPSVTLVPVGKFLILYNSGFDSDYIGIATYARDDLHVYLNASVISNADPVTFKVFPSPDPFDTLYSRDESHIFYSDGMMQVTSPATFAVTDYASTSTDAHDQYKKYLHGQQIIRH